MEIACATREFKITSLRILYTVKKDYKRQNIVYRTMLKQTVSTKTENKRSALGLSH